MKRCVLFGYDAVSGMLILFDDLNKLEVLSEKSKIRC